MHALRLWCVRAETYLSKRRRTVAVTISVGLHALLIALLVTTPPPNTSGGGSGGVSSGSASGSGFGVVLVSMRQAIPDAFTVKQPDPAETIEDIDLKVPELDAPIANTATADNVEMPAVDQASDAVSAAANAMGATPDDQGSTGGVGQGGQSSGVDDELWKQIEPCWRRLTGAGSGGASLRISFSPLGNVAQTAGGDVPGGMDAESQALANQALSECGPYVSAGSRQNVVIAFPPRP